MTKTYNQTIRLIKRIKIVPRWVIFILDLGAGIIALFTALILKSNLILTAIPWGEVFGLLVSSLLINILVFLSIKTYRGIVRFTGLQDALRVMATVALSSLLIIIQFYLNNSFNGNDAAFNTMMVMYAVFFFLFLLGYRVLVKYGFNILRNLDKTKKNVVIYGAGQTGQATKRVLENENIGFSLIAFIDDDKRKDNKRIDGVPVTSFNSFMETADSHSIHEVIIANFGLSPERKNDLVDFCLNHDIHVLTIPRYNQWSNGAFSARQMKKIRIEDLLEREPIQIENQQLLQDIKGKRILVTGAAGSIGSELVRLLNKLEPTILILCDQAETPLHDIELELNDKHSNVQCIPYLTDINNKVRMAALFEKFKPHVVYHAAAYKHVPMMEFNPEEAIKVNALGTQLLADLAIQYKVERFVMISTDKAVNPTNVMGASKRLAEMYVQALSTHPHETKFVTTRFGNVLGSNGSVVLRFREQIERGGPVTITHPHIVRYFMTIPEACQLVLEAGSMANGGEIFVFDMGAPVKISDLAKKMIRLYGYIPNIDIPLKYTGLRPGEKLYEELLVDGENSVKTYHEKIMIAKVRTIDQKAIINQFKLLEIKIASPNTSMQLVRLMKQLVPEFVSNNSEFEQLDTTKVVKLKNG
ncbi:polysaccharide biosynthesis protein [Cyclobacteriaceae bacterium]|nr:polysaccharide biosynthesis protein [Cyclobacteriaceae bacterium]MDB4315579.1 polysaccharide biosynthesis protein [Cyclobacteriaceae bacterium]MDB4605728.1 polysaccharide biosynthesis protein [Cyclobacteriaceae bacterium]MDB4742606.1 polysaccharide biosynthesis protein [Cyclobacteriaceae bacterium]